MTRFKALTSEELTQEQKRVRPKVASMMPFEIWLRIPKLAELNIELLNALRFEGKLDKRLLRLAGILVARHWSADFEWFTQARYALEVGLRRDAVEAIRTGGKPRFVRSDEKLVYDLVTELNETKNLSQARYNRAARELGLDLTIELITAVGFYTMVAMMLKTFDVKAPGGKRVLPCLRR